MKWFARFAAGAVACYCATLAVLWWNQDGMIFFPAAGSGAPVEWGLADAQDVRMESPDGVSLHAWWRAPAPDQPLIVIFSGNAGSPPAFVDAFHAFAPEGWGILATAYRGYFGSEGKPSQRALVADGEQWARWAQAQAPGSRLVIWGQSLGSGVAAETARRVRAAALVLEAPYTTTVAVAENYYPWVPVNLLMRHRFDTATPLRAFDGDVFIMQGGADEVIPPQMGPALLEICRMRQPGGACIGRFPPKGQHGDLRAYGLTREVVSFVRTRLKGVAVSEGRNSAN